MNDRIEIKLTWAVEAGLAVRQAIAAKIMASIADAEYQLRWLEGKYTTIKVGQLAEWALKEGLANVVTHCKQQLACWRPQRSSSAYSNACNDEAYDAYKKFLEDFERYVTVEVKAG